MNGKDTIIQSIKDNASLLGKDLITQAQEEKDGLLKKELEAVEVNCKKLIDESKAQAKLIVSRRQSVGKLEASKVLLSAKQSLIDSVYSQAMDKIVSLNDKDYCKFISDLITKYAENGDCVIVSAKDVKRINASFIETIAKNKKIKLNLSKENHSCKGGIILQGSKYDKNLTLTALVSETRIQTESKTAQNLFGK